MIGWRYLRVGRDAEVGRRLPLCRFIIVLGMVSTLSAHLPSVNGEKETRQVML